jgi:hypothetical protein
MRLALLALALSACVASSKADGPMRNLVCERFAILNPDAKCIPEMSDVGEVHVHTARVTIDKDTMSCGLNAGQLAMVCGPLAVAPQPQHPPAAK